ncbi:MAG TPA: hypothetical protein ENK68_04685 [Epsilonproteobacteria bacterium]|nr:hypothetical protein [Campylobacterota bacterium]
MATPIEYIYENNLQWQPTLNSELSGPGLFGYRGSLVIIPGKQQTPDKQLPPKGTLKQVLLVANTTEVLYLAAELESFSLFEAFVEKYKPILTENSLVTLFAIDLDGNGRFEYEGITFNLFALEESSVWNDTLDFADLSKGDFKKMSSEDKLEKLYEEIKGCPLPIKDLPFDEVKALQNDNTKSFGAV